MRLSYNEKIERINNDRLLMFNTVKDYISMNNSRVSESLKITSSLFNFDEENTKEYKSIVNAKQLIFELTEEISKATSVDEVINLRKKINYYVNKIKKELVKRNVNQEVFNQIYTGVSYLRNNISMYIRFLKRESTLVEISDLYKKIDSLSPDDSDKLKKLLTNELNYNKRVLKTMNSDNTIDLKKTDMKHSSLIENGKDSNIFQLPSEIHDDVEDVVDENISIDFNNVFDTQFSGQIYNILEGADFLTDRIDRYNLQYKFSTLLNYNGTFFKNCVNFFRNIPRYNFNKNTIKLAERDYETFYHGSDLRDFIDYSKKRNSIKVAIEIIFKCSRLSKREIECLFNHDKCKEWIMEFHSPEVYAERDSIRLIKAK